jgi:nucleotide-binding universal stress UspA family protein
MASCQLGSAGLLEGEAGEMTNKSEGRQVVVAGVDGSAESVAALGWAARYAATTGATVRAVRAWHYPGAIGGPAEGIAPSAVREKTEQQMRDDLAEAVAKVYPNRSDAAIETRVSYGHPAQVLIDESKEADLLVVGSHGHGAFTGMMLGSVSIHCVTNASCPVVVVRGR